MAIYVKKKCGNCGVVMQSWSVASKSIGTPLAKCTRCNSIIVDLDNKEWDMINNFEKLLWIINPGFIMFYSIIPGILLIALISMITGEIFEPSTGLITTWLICSIVVIYYLLFKGILACKERMMDSEYRELLRKTKVIQPKIFYTKTSYKGELFDGNPNGFGVLFYRNGAIKYKGEYLNGQFHGRGIVYNQLNQIEVDGKFIYGTYINEPSDEV